MYVIPFSLIEIDIGFTPPQTGWEAQEREGTPQAHCQLRPRKRQSQTGTGPGGSCCSRPFPTPGPEGSRLSAGPRAHTATTAAAPAEAEMPPSALRGS